MKSKVKPEEYKLTNMVISILILLIYATLLIFGITSLISPNWLRDLSKAGRVGEAVTMQYYGDHFLNTGDYEMAIIQYNKALLINPEMAEAHINRGVAYKLAGDYESALKSFEKGLEFEDALQDATYYNMAEIYQEQDKPDMAIQHFLKSAELAPFPLMSYQKAGEIMNNRAQWREATETFNKALANAFTMENCYLGMLKRDYHLFADTITRMKIKKLLDLGISSIDLSSYDEIVFNDALRRDPLLAGIYNQFGYTFAMTENYEKAIEFFNIALQIRPDFQNARSNLNAAYNRMSQQSAQGGQ